ncbi:hypothetical protein TRFO_16520 [Tritrichomonas foetus]|uniref:Uncharacterized protein n=1 Tax=Tritrichomonas foetus TaxID=1144522 RepID=A0A1J4KPT6_9EUKA|nr:hypothetical protein TRFO_16520 [Tritrichomonas foetus]|eukprot:OHT13321.1 hypothetical protein TRFO_16520 [Tritrichomonas foetus]
MVDLNFNYNVAWALSHAKNSSADGTKELLVRQHIKIAELAIQVDRARKVTKETYSNLHKQDIEDLKKQIEDQDAELNELYEILRNQSDAFEDAEAQRQEEFGPLHEGVDEVKKIGEESMLLEKSANEQTQMLIEENINQLRDDLVVKIEEIPVIHNIECDKIQEATDQLLQDPTLAIDEIVAKFDDYKEKVQKMSEIVASNRTTLTAKIVRDKLRCDEFIRDNDNRFEIFAESSHKWDVTVDQLKEAEEMIEDFERGLNTLCPIRGNAQYSPPQSPKASPKPSPKKNLDSEQSQTDRFQLEEEDEEEEEEEAYSCLNSVSSGHK